MHAYGHQWSCQLLYNPRLCKGLGLTDGEGVERMWARLRKLISIVRTSSVSQIRIFTTIAYNYTKRARRVWLTDRQLSAISFELRDDLGDWLKRRCRRGIQEQSTKARAILQKCGITEGELRAQWELQKAAQLSIRARKYKVLFLQDV